VNLIDQTTVTETRELGPCRSLIVSRLSGTVRVSFNGGGEITLWDKAIFELPPGMLFNSVKLRPSPGSSADVVHGLVSFGGGGAGESGTSGQLLTGDGNPNAQGIFPADRTQYAIFYDRTMLYLYSWDTNLQNWQ